MNAALPSPEKKLLRAACAQRLKSIPESVLREASAAIAAQVLASAAYQSARSVFIYVSVGKEVDTRALIQRAWADGKRVYVPKCKGQGQMDAVAVLDWSQLHPGFFGIPEPRDGLRAADPETVFDLAVVPCVCASRDGRRLGHGAGYYDRFLSSHQTYASCLCYEALLSSAVPADPWDKPMDAVVTENGWCEKANGQFINHFFSGQISPNGI